MSDVTLVPSGSQVDDRSVPRDSRGRAATDSQPPDTEDPMDHGTFDRMTRSFSRPRPGTMTRRGITRLLGGLALGGPLALLGLTNAEAKCKKKCGACKRCKQGKCKPKPAGTACAGGTCQGGRCVAGEACVPESAAATCAGRCGTGTNACGQAVACPGCAAGRQCLNNGSCAEICGNGLPACPQSCFCGAASVDAPRSCMGFVSSCEQASQACTTTAECPTGQKCQP